MIKFLMKYGLLGGLCWLLFVASVIFICLWVVVKLVMAVWPWLLALVLAGAIYKLARRMAKRLARRMAKRKG